MRLVCIIYSYVFGKMALMVHEWATRILVALHLCANVKAAWFSQSLICVRWSQPDALVESCWHLWDLVSRNLKLKRKCPILSFVCSRGVFVSTYCTWNSRFPHVSTMSHPHLPGTSSWNTASNSGMAYQGFVNMSLQQWWNWRIGFARWNDHSMREGE